MDGTVLTAIFNVLFADNVQVSQLKYLKTAVTRQTENVFWFLSCFDLTTLSFYLLHAIFKREQSFHSIYENLFEMTPPF